MKKILFLSALDFKEKSIQVIRKTPEAYASADWEVDYIVARDNQPNGNYFYEDEINPTGISIKRLYWPIPKLRAKLGRFSGLLLGKFVSLVVVMKLALEARKMIKKKQYDVVYGYELQGVLAMNLIKFFLPKKTKVVSRFQGTFLNEMFVNRQYFRVFFNLDLVLAIRINSDLLIMTDDGTQGDQAVKKIKRNKPYKMVFWTNGVDLLPENIEKPFETTKALVFMSVSRLVGWKRVDRNLLIMKELVKLGYTDFVYYVIGEGDQKSLLENLCKEVKLENHVVFVGALNHDSVISYLLNAHAFFSMYDSSNVGNPLLEAIRANRIIVTLANGDTSKWIQHQSNGLIYDPVNINYHQIAQDIYDLVSNQKSIIDMQLAVNKTEKHKLLTWNERFKNELKEIDSL